MGCKVNDPDMDTSIDGLNLITCWEGTIEPKIHRDRRKYERMWLLQFKSTQESVSWSLNGLSERVFIAQ